MKIEDLFIGQSYEMSKTFTEQDVETFSNLSLDTNPIHLDEKYAESTVFKRKIVHGFLSSSLISAIIGTKMPGPGSIYLHQEMNFKKPVFIGDVVKAVATITDINKEKSIIYLQTNCYNGGDELTVEGKAVIKL